MSITPFFHVYHKYVFNMNINKIKLSGTTYNIQDLNATKTVELTQAEYDALSPKDPNVFYIITDAKGADLSNYYTKSEADGLLDTKLDVTAYTPTDLSNYYTKSETSGATEISTALASKADTATTYTKTETDNAITAATSTKQDTLVSGTNIKTINGETLLGDGNITIEGGGGGGITSSEVQTMIDESISGKTNQNDNLFTIRTNVIEAVVIAGGKKIRIIFAFDIIQNNQIVLSTDTVNDKTSLLSALATLGFDNNIYDIRNINYDNDTKNTSYFGEFLGHKCYEVLLNYVPDFGSITIGLKRNNVFYTLDSVSNGNYNYNYLINKPEITTSVTSSSTDAQVPSAKAVYDMVGNINTILESI